MKSQFLIKHFYKNIAIRCMIFGTDKRVHLYWAIPKDSVVTINGRSYSCNADKDYCTFYKGIPTFVYNVERMEALNLADIKANPNMNSKDYNTAINNTVAQQIFNAGDKKVDLITACIIGMMAMVLIVAVAGYFMYQKFGDLSTQLTEIREAIRNATGN